jgi:N-acetylglutamate synthase-like GNAT family acetyltransferase
MGVAIVGSSSLSAPSGGANQLGATSPSAAPPGVASSVRRAVAVDLPAVARLIGRAHTADGISGERAEPAELQALAARGHFLALDSGTGELAAVVHVQVDDDCGVLSLLAVAPELRQRGLGRRLVAVVEGMCSALACRAVALDLVDANGGQGRWFRRLGFRPVASAAPGCAAGHMVRLEKSLRP